MRRAFLSIMATVTGLVLLLSFKSHTVSAGSPLAAKATKTKAHPSPSTRSKTTTKATTKAATARTVPGRHVQTQYGPGAGADHGLRHRIIDVTALQLPQQSSRDIEIDNFAVPQLRQEALDAQSANIDSVSGATYTSDGYIRSLQSALDKAG